MEPRLLLTAAAVLSQATLAADGPQAAFVQSDSSTVMASSITQYGVTWTFDQEYEVGTFANGDYWVVGPVTITSVSPGWDGVTNGSMINPDQTESQGYDTRAYNYDSSLRVTFPKTIAPDSSLVTTIGRETAASGGAAQVLSDAAILTVVDAPKASTVFRPSYFGNAKTYYDISDVGYSRLPSLPIPSTPLPDVSNVMVRPWLDHGPNVIGATIHPDNNMSSYPRDSSRQVSQLSLMAMIDTPQQQEYANRLIQLGIDLYPIAEQNTGSWRAQGGFGSGRKWPILFAGIMLDDAGMKAPPSQLDENSPHGAVGDYTFGEDGHTYYGKPTADYPNGKPLWGADLSLYGISSPWFTNHDARDPNGTLEPHQMINGGSYQSCCTSHTWVGQALAAELMGAKNLWDHDAFFDYVQRWTNEPDLWANNSSEFYQDFYGFGGDGGGFMKTMWETHHNSTESAPESMNSLFGILNDGRVYVSKSEGDHFVNGLWASMPNASSWQDIVVGDFNGDGSEDLAARDAAGYWTTWINQGDRFVAQQWGGRWSLFCTWSSVRVGDFDGNGFADIAGRTQHGAWYAAMSDGSSFSMAALGVWTTTVTWDDINTGDFNGDGKSDIVGRASTGTWVILQSQPGGGHANLYTGMWSPNAGWSDVLVGDFNHDGLSDIIGRAQSGMWWAGYSNGAGFDTKFVGSWSTNTTWSDVSVGDFNGDGFSDIAGRAASGMWYVYRSGDPTTISGFRMHYGVAWSPTVNWQDVQIGDFDGNGLSDFVGRADSGAWVVSLSQGDSYSSGIWAYWNPNTEWKKVGAVSMIS